MGMSPFYIIEAKANAEGFSYSLEEVVEAAIVDLKDGIDMAFMYGDILFTVGVETGLVHMYAFGTPFLRSAVRQFMEDVWRLDHKVLFAPLLNKKLGRVAQSFGWEPTGRILPTGHHLYIARRPT